MAGKHENTSRRPSSSWMAKFFGKSDRRHARLAGDEPQVGKGVRFARRLFYLRMVGLGIGSLCVAAAFSEQNAPRWLWIAMLLHGFAWPHLAYQWALNSRIPYNAEQRNLVIDSVLGGFWSIAMQGNLLPSTLILSMMAMDNVAAGGTRLLLRGIIGSIAGLVLGMAVLDFHFTPETPLSVTIACLPMLVLYPLALGKSTYDMSLKLAERSRQFESASQRDGLTGLFNRRYWESLLMQEFKECNRDRKRMSCLMLLDLDHFKKINDTQGHLVGDEVLRRVSQFLRENIRGTDRIGRYGGEEFVVLLGNTPLPDAEALALRLLEHVRERNSQQQGLLGCTLSAGLVPFSAEMSTRYAWLRMADEAMYEAKRLGRDRLVVREYQEPA